MSKHTIDAYIRDIAKLADYALRAAPAHNSVNIPTSCLQSFLKTLYDLGISERSQARILSGIRSFYKYLSLEDIIEEDPTEQVDSPKLKRKIPEVLSYGEVASILGAIDMSTTYGHRDRAMLETLYACGLRVSELIGLKISNVYFDVGFVRVIGKNNKERLVPIAPEALRHIRMYLEGSRRYLPYIDPAAADVLFLNLRGRGLSRVSVFNMIRRYTALAGVQKTVSPHTFRHSFATHLVEGGADLRAVQQMLGHESILTTEIYTHLDREYLRATILQFHPQNKYD